MYVLREIWVCHSQCNLKLSGVVVLAGPTVAVNSLNHSLSSCERHSNITNQRHVSASTGGSRKYKQWQVDRT
jgi:hypothetical protein